MRNPDYYIERLKAKDQAAFSEFFQDTKYIVFVMVILITNGSPQAHEALKASYEEFVRRAYSYHVGQPFIRWLLNIAKETATKFYWEDLKNPSALPSRDKLTDDLEPYLGGLDYGSRQIYLLHQVAGISLKTVRRFAAVSLPRLLYLDGRSFRMVEHASLALGNDKETAPAAIIKILDKHLPDVTAEITLSEITPAESNDSGKIAYRSVLIRAVALGIIFILFIILYILVLSA